MDNPLSVDLDEEKKTLPNCMKQINRGTFLYCVRLLTYPFPPTGSHRYQWHVSQSPESLEAGLPLCIVVTQLSAKNKQTKKNQAHH